MHAEAATVDDEVASFHKLDAHLLREEAVFEISAVVNARRHQNDLGIVFAARLGSMHPTAKGAPEGDDTPTSASSSRSAWRAISLAPCSTQASISRSDGIRASL